MRHLVADRFIYSQKPLRQLQPAKGGRASSGNPSLLTLLEQIWIDTHAGQSPTSN
jgi:hypothetical protein